MQENNKELLDGLKIDYKKNTYNLDEEAIYRIENQVKLDKSFPEKLSIYISEKTGITKEKFDNVVEFWRVKKQNSLQNDMYTNFLLFASIDRIDSIEELLDEIFSDELGRVDKRRLANILELHFEDLKKKILETFSSEIKNKVEEVKSEIKKGDI